MYFPRKLWAYLLFIFQTIVKFDTIVLFRTLLSTIVSVFSPTKGLGTIYYNLFCINGQFKPHEVFGQQDIVRRTPHKDIFD